MATTFGIKTLGIFGGGHFNRFFNSGSKDAQIVYHPMECFQCHWNCVYRDFRCIRAITVDEVYEKAGRLLREPLVLSEASKEAREEDWENRFRARDWEKRAWRKAFYTQRTKNSLPKDSLEMQDGSPQPLPDSALRVGFSNVKIPPTLKANEKVEVHLSVKNEGDGVWPAKGLYGGPTYQVNLTYYWLDPKGKRLDDERRRVPLPRDLYPGDTVELMVELVAPEAPGTYFLNFEMVQETVAWFGQKNPESLLSIPIQIL
jgi:hypothetical protein